MCALSLITPLVLSVCAPQEFIDKVINFDETGAIRKPSLFLLGGIQINMPKPMPDFFMPLLFEERNADGTVLNLMESTFGQK